MKDEYGVIEFLETFTDEFCKEYFMKFRAPAGRLFCPYCGYDQKAYVIEGGKRFKCGSKECYKKYALFTGTVFEGTNLTLRQWFFMIYCNSNYKKNISSIQIAKNLSVTQNSSWKAQAKLRSIMYQDIIQLKGVVEVDEAFCAKGNRWNRWGGFSTRKEPILGMVERGGRVILKTITDRERGTILKMITEFIEPGSIIYTDGWASYKNLSTEYKHDFVEHSSHEYVRGDVHTNTIENVWSFFKKNIRNAHHSISSKHLQAYLDEAAFKYNNRKLNQMERFDKILSRGIYG